MKKCKVFVILLLITTLTGCSKYEKDESYTTDIYGTYSDYVEASNISYSRNDMAFSKFSSDNTPFANVYSVKMSSQIYN